jgi:GT2 family glycosyltransferase
MIDFVLIGKIDDAKRYSLLQQTIETFNKTVPKELIHRFVFVDDCSIFKIGAENLFGKFPVHYKYNTKKQLGVGGSKNRGIGTHMSLGRGKLVYLFDGDVYFTEGWLQKLLAVYEAHHDRFKIIGGGIHPYLQPRADEGTIDITSHDAISGWSWLLSYETIEQYGLLADNALGTGQSEDWEYCQRIRNAGFLVGCITPQVVAHCGMTNSEGKEIVGKEVSEQLTKSVAPQALLL